MTVDPAILSPEWTGESLRRLIEERLRGFRFVCVANREPYIHDHGSDGIRCFEPDSGVVTALNPVMQATGGVWIAHGSGTADREAADARGRLRVPPGRDYYTLRRVWLTPEQERGYYYGFSNGALWPLCHTVYRRPVFETSDWRRYVEVNEKFADAVVEEIAGDRAIVFIQDYHFALLSKLIKARLPGAIVCQFWHIPWPNPDVFRICPWKREILEGLLGNDLLAFHIQYHCNNFLEAVDREIEARIDRERFSVTMRGSQTLVRPHPISVDFEALSTAAADAAGAAGLDDRYRLRGRRVLLSAGRLDYTKGILERIRAYDRLLERRADLADRVVLLEVGIPTRSALDSYREFQAAVEREIVRVNARHGTPGWTPIVHVKEHQDRARLVACYRRADVCLVTSLHDGMNLVAKEYVAARSDGQGVLVLSRFTGAARELTQAVLVNPYDADELAGAMEAALAVPPAEQRARMERMRQTVRDTNVYKWAGKLLTHAARLEPS